MMPMINIDYTKLMKWKQLEGYNMLVVPSGMAAKNTLWPRRLRSSSFGISIMPLNPAGADCVT